MLADADRLAAELLLGSALLAERTLGVVALEESDTLGVGPAAGRRLRLLLSGHLEERHQVRQVSGGDRGGIVHSNLVGLEDLPGPDQVSQAAPVEEVGLESRLLDGKTGRVRAPGAVSGGRCFAGRTLRLAGGRSRCRRRYDSPGLRLKTNVGAGLLAGGEVHRLLAVRTAEARLDRGDP